MIRINTKIRIRRLSIDSVSLFICAYVTLMILAEMFETEIPGQFRYVDELFAVIAAFYIVYHVLINRPLSKLAIQISVSVMLMVLLGAIGNIVYGIHYTIKSVVLDVFLFLKIYLSLLFFIITIKGERVSLIYHYMLVMSKLYLFCVTVFSLLSIGNNNANGIYSFYYKYVGSLAWWAVLFLAIIYSDKNSNRLLYFLLTVYLVMRNGSGLGMLNLGIVAAVYFFVEKSKRIQWYHLLIIVFVCISVGWREISGYLMNTKSPRFLLIYYGFITANTCFPLGSGFATYASAQAAKDYSRLYYKYGFDRVWGMTSSQKSFIQDSYYPVIIGQLGYLGAVVFAFLCTRVLNKLILPIRDKYCRCGALIAFLTWLAAGLGFLGSATTWGCCIYMVIVLLCVQGNKERL